MPLLFAACPTRSLVRLLLFPLLILLCPVASAGPRQKTDVIELKNGDRVTGEIKKLDRDILSVRTDYMGTVSIEWDDIRRVTSQYSFEIRLSEGQRLYGTLQPGTRERTLEFVSPSGPVLIDQEFIVEVTPIEERIWNRFKGSVDLGFNFLKANNNTQYSLTGNLSYRGRKWFSSAAVESHVSDRSDAARVTRNDVDLTANRMLQAGNWFIPMLAQYQTNSELQLDYRTLTGGGVGRVLDQTSRGLLMVGALATYTREAYFDQGTTNGAEGLIFLRVERFKLDSPKLNFLANLKVFPGLSDFGRIRVELDSQLRYEIFKDFYWGVTFYDSFDSRPPSTDGAIKNDYGVGTTVGWSF